MIVMTFFGSGYNFYKIFYVGTGHCHSDDELRFMYENGQGHLTSFCIVFCLTRGTLQKKWFMYQNRLGPSDGIYYPNFVPCFVYHQLNMNRTQIKITDSVGWLISLLSSALCQLFAVSCKYFLFWSAFEKNRFKNKSNLIKIEL